MNLDWPTGDVKWDFREFGRIRFYFMIRKKRKEKIGEGKKINSLRRLCGSKNFLKFLLETCSGLCYYI